MFAFSIRLLFGRTPFDRRVHSRPRQDILQGEYDIAGLTLIEQMQSNMCRHLCNTLLAHQTRRVS
jgi:hypothetical protein